MKHCIYLSVACWLLLAFVPAPGSAGAQITRAVDFGRVRPGTSAVDSVQILNPDTHSWLVDSATVTGSCFDLPASPFTGSPILLDPGQALTLLVRYSPPDTGEHHGQLSWLVDTSYRSTLLLGTGVREVVVIDEVHADPASGAAGDANRDGVRSSNEDEFVELLNTGLRPVDIGGWQLSDARSPENKRFTFPEPTWLGGSERVVLFGGGVVTGIPASCFVDDGKIGGGLSNSGDMVFLVDPAGPDTLARASYGKEGGRDQSVVRYLRGRGPFVLHTSRPGSGERFSPGRARAVLSQVEIVFPDPPIEVGTPVQLRAEGVFGAGIRQEMSGEVTWTVARGRADLSGGLLVAAEPGSLLIRAETVWGISGQTGVWVNGPDPIGLRVSPAETSVVAGDNFVCHASMVYPDASVAQQHADLVWSSSDSLVVRYAGDGLVNSVAAGSAWLRAIAVGVKDSGLVRVGHQGDLDLDGSVGLRDAVRTVHLILGDAPGASAYERRSADANRDGSIDVLDLVAIINRLLDLPEGSPKASGPVGGYWTHTDSVLAVRVPAPLRCLQFDLTGPADVTCAEPEVLGLQKRSAAPRKPVTRWIVFSVAAKGMPVSNGEVKLHLVPLSTERSVSITAISAVDVFGRPVRLVSGGQPPVRPILLQNRPNPFNAATEIRYSLPRRQRVRLRVISVLGQEVAVIEDGFEKQGDHRAVWDGRDASGRPVGSGVYIALLETRAVVLGHKMVMLR